MKTSLVTATIVTASLFISSAQAQESYLTTMVNNMVASALTVSTNELKADVYQSIANATYHFSLDESTASGKVSISDIAQSTTRQPEAAPSDDD